MKEFEISGRILGSGHPCFVIAEAGVNHNGNLEMAHQLVDVAVNSGADAIKFQTFNAERLVGADAPKAAYQLKTTNISETQLEMLQRLELPVAAHRELIAHCKEKNVIFLSTPFDEISADLLESLDVPAFKVPSGEITNLPFISHLARKNKPLIVSTGMSTLGEVETAIRAIEAAGNKQFALLQCVSNYPANPEDINLRAMQTMAQAFNVQVGYSDHTTGPEVSLAAVALGACIIEKHFTLDRNLPGPDHLASAEPKEFSDLVRSIRIVETSLGNGRKQPAASESNTMSVARKSLIAACEIAAGTRVTESMIAIKRPGTGLPPAMREFFIGRVARTLIPSGAILNLEMFG
ncbi:MAG: N-acetylneuraminate synthase [Chloroflexota bacterium]